MFLLKYQKSCHSEHWTAYKRFSIVKNHMDIRSCRQCTSDFWQLSFHIQYFEIDKIVLTYYI